MIPKSLPITKNNFEITLICDYFAGLYIKLFEIIFFYLILITKAYLGAIWIVI